MSHQSQLIAEDIQAYLKQHENKDMLRFLTCGSVDDGKSTLIGRLLFDSKMVFEDHMQALEQDSKKFNTTNEEFDLALLVDGLQAEREQGITIDVAYRYFSTDTRKFIIADTPGHEQYTRNMATGASTCDLAIILIDARHGVQVQTRRHSFITSLLGIKHVIVAVNKMDLVDFSQDTYKKIKADYREFVKDLGFTDVRFVPVSALNGDNVVTESENMPWYPGATLMKLLDTVDVSHTDTCEEFRFPVQYVNRPNLNYRGFAGTIAAGSIRVGDTVVALPSMKESEVKSIDTFDGELEAAEKSQAVTITLTDEIDVSRGDMLCRPSQKPLSAKAFTADVVWMAEEALQTDREYIIKLAGKSVFGHATSIDYQVNVNTLEQAQASQLNLNEIGRCHFEVQEAVHFDQYKRNRETGAFIIIDRLTNNTVAAGMVADVAEEKGSNGTSEVDISAFELELNALVRKHFPHWQARDISKLLKD